MVCVGRLAPPGLREGLLQASPLTAGDAGNPGGSRACRRTAPSLPLCSRGILPVPVCPNVPFP